MIFALSIGSAISSLLSWFADIFLTIWNACVELFKWLCIKAYNVVLDVFEFMFKEFVDTFIYLLDYFPDVDLSGLDEGLSTLLKFWEGFDQILPLSEIFACVGSLFTYFIVFTIIRLVVKLVPTIG